MGTIDDSRLQSYIDKIQEIKKIDTGEYFNGFDVGQIQGYATALKDVDASQASLLLSTQGLSNAQIHQTLQAQKLTVAQQYQAMADAGLLKAKQELTNVELQSTLQSLLNDEQKTKETLSILGVSAAIEGEEAQVVELTGKKMAELAATGKLNQELAEELAMHTGVDLAMKNQNYSVMPKWQANMEAMGKVVKDKVSNTLSWVQSLSFASKALMGVGAVVGVATIAYTVYKKHLEEVRQATDKAATAYKESASSIDNYVTRYKELQTALKEAKGNAEETYAIKKQLLDLQTEINDKYGDEYGKINLVTDAYKDQTEAIRALSKEDANRFLNENQKGIEDATNQMSEERNYALSSTMVSLDTPEGKELEKIIASYADKGMYALPSGDGTIQIHLEADAETAYDTINDFETDVRNKAKELGNEKLFDDILAFSSDALEDAKSIIGKYSNIYNQALMSQLVTDDSSSEIYTKALTAVEEYNNAVLLSEDPFNDEKVSEAKANIEALKAEFADNEDWSKFSSLFNDVFDQADTRLLDFNEKLKNDTSLQKFAEQLRGMDSADFESLENAKHKDAFASLTEAANEYELSTEEVIDTLVRLGYVQGDASDATDELTDNLGKSQSKMIDTLNSMSDSFNMLDNIYADIADKGSFDFSNLDSSKFAEVFSGLEDDYTKFIETIAASPNDIDKCQTAFNELVTAYINSKGILENLTEENAELTASMLENMGVANAEEVILDSLAQKERNLAVETEIARLEAQKFTFAKLGEVNALLQTEGATNISQIALARYALAKMNSNGVTVDSSKDVEEVLKLGESALLSTECIAQLTRAKTIMSAVESAGGDIRKAGVTTWEYYDALKTIDEINAGTYEFKTQAIDLSKLLTDYSGGVDSATHAQNNLADTTNTATNALQEQTDALEKEKEALEETKSEMEEYHDAVIWFYDQQIDKIDEKIEAINKESDTLEAKKEQMDQILSAIENNYDTEIQAIQDKIDALKSSNKEEEKALALEEAKRKLWEARSRKTVQVYEKGKGFVYTVDDNAIKEAEKELENLQAEMHQDAIIAELEAQIDKLEEAKQKWSEIPEAYEKAMQEIAASDYFGSNWASATIFPSDKLLNSFQNNYTGIQSEIAANEDRIASYEVEKEAVENLKQLWNDAKNAYTYAEYEKKLQTFIGSDYEYELLNNSAIWREEYATKYAEICTQIKALEEEIKLASEGTSTAVSNIGTAAQTSADQVNTLNASLDAINGKQTESTHTHTNITRNITYNEGNSNSPYGPSNPYQSATDHAHNNGYATYAKGGIITRKAAGNLDYVAKALGEDHMIAVQEGEAVIPKKSVRANENLVKSLINGNIMPDANMLQENYARLMSSLHLNILKFQPPNYEELVSRQTANKVVQFHGDIHLHEVQDADGLSKAILTKLPMAMLRELNRRDF